MAAAPKKSKLAPTNGGEAVVELSADVADDALKAAVEAQDYKVLGID